MAWLPFLAYYPKIFKRRFYWGCNFDRVPPWFQDVSQFVECEWDIVAVLKWFSSTIFPLIMGWTRSFTKQNQRQFPIEALHGLGCDHQRHSHVDGAWFRIIIGWSPTFVLQYQIFTQLIHQKVYQNFHLEDNFVRHFTRFKPTPWQICIWRRRIRLLKGWFFNGSKFR